MTHLMLVSEAHWIAAGAVAAMVTSIFILGTGLLVFWQLWDLRKSSSVQVWSVVVDRLQAPDVRAARGFS